ncbi:hypothetical protein ACQKMV_22755 [Lysinibacillus sp. NPDC094403]|uniref:hypothetical protein n=1 Tax=Lysinibacillus sp. NPDC094403 TaxID=3390581 RepID=UPI003CFE5BA1
MAINIKRGLYIGSITFELSTPQKNKEVNPLKTQNTIELYLQERISDHANSIYVGEKSSIHYEVLGLGLYDLSLKHKTLPKWKLEKDHEVDYEINRFRESYKRILSELILIKGKINNLLFVYEQLIGHKPNFEHLYKTILFDDYDNCTTKLKKMLSILEQIEAKIKEFLKNTNKKVQRSLLPLRNRYFLGVELHGYLRNEKEHLLQLSKQSELPLILKEKYNLEPKEGNYSRKLERYDRSFL